jgi:hypothetical protein
MLFLFLRLIISFNRALGMSLVVRTVQPMKYVVQDLDLLVMLRERQEMRIGIFAKEHSMMVITEEWRRVLKYLQ